MNRFHLFSWGAALLAACSSVTSRTKDANSPFEGPLTCTQGWEPLVYSLSPVQASEDISQLPLLGVTGFRGEPPVRNASGLRLEVCFEANTLEARLERLLFQGGDGRRVYLQAWSGELEWSRRRDGVFYRVPSASLQPKGLSEALMGEVSGLLLELPLNLESFVLAASAQKNVVAGWAWTNTGEPRPSVALVGQLKDGDAFADDSDCQPGFSRGRVEHHFGTARILVELCSKPVGVSGTHYEVKSIRVTDDNEALPPELRQERLLEKDDLARALTWTITHHNQCDALRVALPEVTYAWTRNGDCDSPLEGAPDGRGFGQFSVRITYPGQEPVEFQAQ